MVSVEARRRHEVEVSERRVQSELARTKSKLDSERSAVLQLRRRLSAMSVQQFAARTTLDISMVSTATTAAFMTSHGRLAVGQSLDEHPVTSSAEPPARTLSADPISSTTASHVEILSESHMANLGVVPQTDDFASIGNA